MRRTSSILVLGFAGMWPALAATSISVQPSVTARAGQLVTVNVNIAGAADLYAYQLDIGFDPAVLSAVSVTEGPFLRSGGPTVFIPGAIDNVTGAVTFNGGALVGALPGVSGGGALLTITFVANGAGSSPITASNVVLLDSALNPLSASASGANVVVQPAGCTTASPLTSLVGLWTFSMEGFVTPTQPFVSVGQFTAAIGSSRAAGAGILTVVSSASINGQIIRRETDPGGFQVYSDCSGGTLDISLSGRSLVFEFYFVNGGNEIRFVSTTAGAAVKGAAVAGGMTCAPPPANPLTTLSGAWTYSIGGFVPTEQPFASAGQFTPRIGSGGLGLLSIVNTESSSLLGQVVRGEKDVGTYQIFPDCSGGTLSFNLSTRPLAFDFWFLNNGEIRMVGITPGVTLEGSAK